MTELLVYGVVLGSIMALGAIGLTLLYGVLRFAHFAHGDLMTLGAYVVLLLNVELLPALGIPELKWGPLSFGGRMLGSLVVSMGVTALVALLIDRILYHPLRARRSSPAILAIASLGMAFILRSLIYIIWGPQFLFYSQELRPAWELPLEVRLKPDQVFILVMVLLLVLLLYLFLQRTKLGKAMRATADNPQLAWVCGIDTGACDGLDMGDRCGPGGGCGSALWHRCPTAPGHGVELSVAALRSRDPGRHRQSAGGIGRRYHPGGSPTGLDGLPAAHL